MPYVVQQSSTTPQHSPARARETSTVVAVFKWLVDRCTTTALQETSVSPGFVASTATAVVASVAVATLLELATGTVLGPVSVAAYAVLGAAAGLVAGGGAGGVPGAAWGCLLGIVTDALVGSAVSEPVESVATPVLASVVAVAAGSLAGHLARAWYRSLDDRSRVRGAVQVSVAAVISASFAVVVVRWFVESTSGGLALSRHPILAVDEWSPAWTLPALVAAGCGLALAAGVALAVACRRAFWVRFVVAELGGLFGAAALGGLVVVGVVMAGYAWSDRPSAGDDDPWTIVLTLVILYYASGFRVFMDPFVEAIAGALEAQPMSEELRKGLRRHAGIAAGAIIAALGVGGASYAAATPGALWVIGGIAGMVAAIAVAVFVVLVAYTDPIQVTHPWHPPPGGQQYH